MSHSRDILRRLAQHGVVDEPEVAVRLSVGLDKFIERWGRETLPFVAAGGAELRFVEGANGRGKTHFLQILESYARRAGFLTARIGTQCKPFAALQDTYREIACGLCGGFSGVNGQSGLAHLLGHLAPDQLTAYQQQARGNPGFRNLVVTYSQRIATGRGNERVTEDLQALLLHNTNRHVTFGDLFRTEPQLPRPLGRLGKRNAALWLRSLLALPRQLGFKGLVVLFDETGADLHLRPEPLRARQQHMANLRNLVDHLATGGVPACSIVYATTNDFIQMAFEDYPAMWQRVARMDGGGPFEEQTRNPRAVWCQLDELTEPSPAETDFFVTLGGKLIDLAREAQVAESSLVRVGSELPKLAQDMSQDLTQGVIRQFIKRMASRILRAP